MGLVLSASDFVTLLNPLGNVLLSLERVAVREIGVFTARIAPLRPPFANRLLRLKGWLHPDPKIAEIGRFLMVRGLPNQGRD